MGGWGGTQETGKRTCQLLRGQDRGESEESAVTGLMDGLFDMFFVFFSLVFFYGAVLFLVNLISTSWPDFQEMFEWSVLDLAKQLSSFYEFRNSSGLGKQIFKSCNKQTRGSKTCFVHPAAGHEADIFPTEVYTNVGKVTLSLSLTVPVV